MARIVLAEDDASMRQFLANSLRRAGHEVTDVSDGLAALSTLDSNEVDLLLADVVMPGLDGVELARRAAQQHPKIKVMFITGFAAVALRGRNRPTPGARVLSKPFHLRDLVEAVDSVLANA